MTNRSLLVMHNIRAAAKRAPQRIIFADGESDRVLEACRVGVVRGLRQADAAGPARGHPKRARRVEHRPEGRGAGRLLVRRSATRRWRRCCSRRRRATATTWTRRGGMVQLPIHHGCMLLRAGEADGMVCGAQRSYVETLKIVLSLAEMKPGVSRVVGMHVLLIEGRAYVFADTTVNFKPDAPPAGGHRRAGLRSGPPLRHRPERGDAVVLELRRQRPARSPRRPRRRGASCTGNTRR